jgi:hypothetical protein
MKAPDERSRRVLRNGKPNASKAVIPYGGHTPPISIAGDRLE